MGTKFLAPMLFAAAAKGLGMADVLHWVDSREDQEVKNILEAAGIPAAVDAWESSQYRTDRAVDSLYATAEEVLGVYAAIAAGPAPDGWRVGTRLRRVLLRWQAPQRCRPGPGPRWSGRLDQRWSLRAPVAYPPAPGWCGRAERCASRD
jgi:hypothetical protein